MEYLGLIKYFELGTALLATVHYSKYKSTFLKFLMPLLWLVVLLEFSIWAMRHYYGITFQNNYLYNLLNVTQHFFFLLVYYKFMKRPGLKTISFCILVVYAIAVAYNLIWLQQINSTTPFHTFSFTVGAVLLILSIFLFFLDLLKSEQIINISYNLLFWISLGLIVFNTGILPFVYSINFKPDLLGSDVICWLFFFLNAFMYLSFAIGFIKSHREITGNGK